MKTAVPPAVGSATAASTSSLDSGSLRMSSSLIVSLIGSSFPARPALTPYTNYAPQHRFSLPRCVQDTSPPLTAIQAVSTVAVTAAPGCGAVTRGTPVRVVACTAGD